MSFLTEAAARRLAMTSRVTMISAPRHFTTSIAYRKTATETVKDTVKQVDRAVSDKLVDGINATTDAAQKITNSEMAGKVQGTAEEIRGKAAGQTEELKGQAKGATHEAAGAAKGAANKL